MPPCTQRPAPLGKSCANSGTGRESAARSMTLRSAGAPSARTPRSAIPNSAAGTDVKPGHTFFEGAQLAIADPVRQEPRRLTRVHDLTDMRTCVGQAEHDVRVGQHLADRRRALVQERPVEQTAAIGTVEKIEPELDRRDPHLAGHRRKRPIGIECVVGRRMLRSGTTAQDRFRRCVRSRPPRAEPAGRGRAPPPADRRTADRRVPSNSAHRRTACGWRDRTGRRPNEPSSVAGPARRWRSRSPPTRGRGDACHRRQTCG